MAINTDYRARIQQAREAAAQKVSNTNAFKQKISDARTATPPATGTTSPITTTQNNPENSTGIMSSPDLSGITDITQLPLYQQYLQSVQKSQEAKNAQTQSIVDAMKKQSEDQKNIFNQVYGEGIGSRLSQYYNPQITEVERSIAESTDRLSRLDRDVTERTQDAGVTESLRRRIVSKESEPITEGLQQQNLALQQLTAGFDRTKQLADQEYNALIEQSKAETEALRFELENKGFDDPTIKLIESALGNQISQLETRRKEDAEAKVKEAEKIEKEAQAKEKQFSGMIDGIFDTLKKAGVTPSAKLKAGLEEARARLKAGEPIETIQADLESSIGSNPQVRKYYDAQIKKITGTGTGTKTSDASPQDVSTFKLFFPDGVFDKNDQSYLDQSPSIREAIIRGAIASGQNIGGTSGNLPITPEEIAKINSLSPEDREATIKEYEQNGYDVSVFVNAAPESLSFGIGGIDYSKPASTVGIGKQRPSIPKGDYTQPVGIGRGSSSIKISPSK